MGLVTMSNNELARLKVIHDLIARNITPAHAAILLKITTRQVRTLRRRFLEHGPTGLTSRHRGKPSNRATPAFFKDQVMELIRAHYHDFGPTFAAEKLKEKHGLRFSPNTIRAWMKQEGLWLDRRQRRQPVHQPRYRRECYGELVQIDGSEHHWFEDRGPPCTLLVYIDDATSRLMQLKFVQSESAFSYFAATTEYLQRHGKPVAFYSDKHSIFRITKKGAVTGDGMTQFGRVLHELAIDIICANTPQAKGRVERANRTLQDRLVKELRLKGISTLEAANDFLSEFMEDYNSRFGKEAANPKDLHRPLRPEEDLREVFAWREERTVSSSLTLQYDKMVFILEPSDYAKGLVRKQVTVRDYPDGRLLISHDGLPLPYTKFDKVRMVTQGAIADNKRLGSLLEVIKVSQQHNGVYRSQHAPRRADQTDSIFNRPNRSISEVKKRRRSQKPTAGKAIEKVRRIVEPPLDLPADPAESIAVSRLPLGFDHGGPINAFDLDTQVMLDQMALRNYKADLEWRALKLRRFQSQRKYLKVLAEKKGQKSAA
jgi:hypothetical protein